MWLFTDGECAYFNQILSVFTYIFVKLSSLLWWELGTNLPGEWLSFWHVTSRQLIQIPRKEGLFFFSFFLNIHTVTPSLEDYEQVSRPTTHLSSLYRLYISGEHPLWVQEVAGSILGLVIPKALKMFLAVCIKRVSSARKMKLVG